MDITIKLTENDMLAQVIDRVGYENLAERIAFIADDYIANFGTHKTSGNMTKKEMIRLLIKEMKSGTPNQFLAAFRNKYPEASIRYATIGVYLRELREEGYVHKRGRGDYIYVTKPHREAE